MITNLLHCIKEMSILYLLKALTCSLLIHWVEPTKTTVETTRETVCARIMNVSVFSDMPEQRLDEIHQVTSFDASLQSVMKLVLEGWPADKHETPVRAVPYFDVHDCLSAVDGILLKGEAVVIPMALRPSIKKWLYSAHLGRDSVLCWARGTTSVLAQHGQWHQANSWYVWNLQGNEAMESTRTT